MKPNIASWEAVNRVLRIHVEPIWGDRSLQDIRRSDVHELLDTIVSDGKQGTAREVRKHLSRLFSWAVDREIITNSPTTNLKRSDLQANNEAGRSLSDQELRYVWTATSDLGYPFGTLYQVLILTGQRRNDWASASHSEINVERRALEISRARYKSDRDHVVPLAPTVWELLEGLPNYSVRPSFIFSTTSGAKQVSGFSKAKTRLDNTILSKAGQKLTDFRVHDFRVTCETRLASLGFNQEIRDAVLGHARPGLQKTYNKYDYYEEKKQALHAYATHVLGVIR